MIQACAPATAASPPACERPVYLSFDTGHMGVAPLVAEVQRLLLAHLEDHYTLYGEYTGVRSARKHIGWYTKTLPGGEAFRARMNALEDAAAQVQAVTDYFDALGRQMDRMPAAMTPLGDNLETCVAWAA